LFAGVFRTQAVKASLLDRFGLIFILLLLFLVLVLILALLFVCHLLALLPVQKIDIEPVPDNPIIDLISVLRPLGL
jgi:uncharacterized BrkB/YihY/UPF0761 family membrane protein